MLRENEQIDGTAERPNFRNGKRIRLRFRQMGATDAVIGTRLISNPTQISIVRPIRTITLVAIATVGN